MWLVDISAQSEADAAKARADLENCKVRLGKVKQALKLASANLDDAQKQFAGSAKVVEKALRQLTEMSSRAQLLVGEITFLHS